MTDTTGATPTREHVFDWIRARGADRAIVEFSGGHDEGGVDDIRLTDPESGACVMQFEEEVAPHFETDPFGTTVYQSQTLTDGSKVRSPVPHTPTAQQSETQAYVDALSQPVYDSYHSFAGEFTVNGAVVWDAARKRVYMEGEEHPDLSEPIDEEL